MNLGTPKKSYCVQRCTYIGIWKKLDLTKLGISKISLWFFLVACFFPIWKSIFRLFIIFVYYSITSFLIEIVNSVIPAFNNLKLDAWRLHLDNGRKFECHKNIVIKTGVWTNCLVFCAFNWSILFFVYVLHFV